MDFTPKPSAEWSANFEAIIDRAMQAKQQAEPRRNYIGASRVGEECLRKLGFEFHGTPKDPDREFSGRTLRIFERGHAGEDNMAARLRLAGFHLVTHKPDGRQIGFATAWSDEAQAFQFSGHLDGVVTASPYESGVVCPALWENKVLGDRGFKELVRLGVRAAKPVYFAQMQLYMAYLDLAANPGLFTAENGNTGEIYAERVPFDAAAAQAASDKGVKVVQSRDPFDLPRCAKAATDYRCKMCDYPGTCWAEQAPAPAAVDAPANWQFGQ